MPDSSGRELQVGVTYANIGLVIGSKLMNESPLAVHGRESRAAPARAHARGCTRGSRARRARVRLQWNGFCMIGILTGSENSRIDCMQNSEF